MAATTDPGYSDEHYRAHGFNEADIETMSDKALAERHADEHEDWGDELDHDHMPPPNWAKFRRDPNLEQAVAERLDGDPRVLKALRQENTGWETIRKYAVIGRVQQARKIARERQEAGA